jgi:hypothetical protein
MSTEFEESGDEEVSTPDLRGVLESSFETVEAAKPVDTQPLSTDVAPVSTAPQSTDSPAVPEEGAAKVSQETPPKEGVPPEAAQVEQQKLAKPPQSWRGDAKQVWNDIPVAARQEIQRRELDQQAALRENASARNAIRSVNEVVSPHMDWIQAEKENPTELMGRMFNMERVARFGTTEQKADLAAEYLIAYGIDLQQLDTILAKRMSSPTQPAQPNIDLMVKQRVEQELQPFREQQLKQQADVDRSVQEELTAFADTHPYFEDVRLEMSDFIDAAAKRGHVLTLEDAYKRAVSFHPELALRQQEELTRVKTAASSVSGTPRGVVRATDPNDLRALLSVQMGGE